MFKRSSAAAEGAPLRTGARAAEGMEAAGSLAPSTLGPCSTPDKGRGSAPHHGRQPRNDLLRALGVLPLQSTASNNALE